MTKKMARKQEEQPVSLDGVRHDEIDHVAALAVLTTSKELPKKPKGYLLLIAIEQVITAVQESFTDLKISISQVNRCIKRWIKMGWITKQEATEKEPMKFFVTQVGLPHLNLLAGMV